MSRGALVAGWLFSNSMGASEAQDHGAARLQLACGRIVNGVRDIAEAYRFGAAEGPHQEPWTAEYLREAIKIYGQSLPRSYQQNMAALFSDGAEAMAAQSIPADLAEEWLIVTEYMRQASIAIDRWLGSRKPKSPLAEVPSPEIDDHTPSVVRFERLAGLTTRAGVERLERAALAVRRHLGAPMLAGLDDDQLNLLRKLASGVSIHAVAGDLHYSDRTIYRAIQDLCRDLGVENRVQAILKAAKEGLFD